MRGRDGGRFGDSVAVVGCGGVGLNAIQGAVLVGAQPIVGVDLQPDRLELAERLGATAVVDAGSDGLAEQLDALSLGGFDVTVVAVGSAAALELAWSVTGRGGTCVVMGKTPDGVRIDFDSQTLGGERRLVGSSYGSVRPNIDFPASSACTSPVASSSTSWFHTGSSSQKRTARSMPCAPASSPVG